MSLKKPPVAHQQHFVRLATRADREGLHSWLRKEAENDGEGFFGNWGSIQRAYRNGHLSVLVKGRGAPVGFAVHDHEEIGKLAIRKRYRGKGLGHHFVRTLLWASEHRGSPGVFLRDVLPRAVRFWEHEGFRVIPTEMTWGMGSPECIVMVRIFEKARSVTQSLRRVRVGVAFTYEPWSRNAHVPCGEPMSTEGILDRNGCMHLIRPCVTLISFGKRKSVLVRVTVNDVPVVEDVTLEQFCMMNEINMEGTRFFIMRSFGPRMNLNKALGAE